LLEKQLQLEDIMNFLYVAWLGIPLVEWFGYAASVVVAVSLTMSSIVKLRWYNLVGAAMFSTYGFVIGALPVGLLNAFIVAADIYYIIKMYREKDEFRIMGLSGDSEYLDYFLECHQSDIRRFFPRFDADLSDGRSAFYLVKNSVPIGLLVGRPQGADGFKVELDYVGPEYRDFKMGRWVYGSSGHFRQQGYQRILSDATGGGHDAYLEKMGFVRQGEQFVKTL
jgi:hypothetical protein